MGVLNELLYVMANDSLLSHVIYSTCAPLSLCSSLALYIYFVSTFASCKKKGLLIFEVTSISTKCRVTFSFFTFDVVLLKFPFLLFREEQGFSCMFDY